MSQFARISTLRADEFLATDQSAFGDAWRYELVDGAIVAHAAPAPEHGRILAGLITALGKRLSGGKSGCRPESGSAVVPETRQRNTARIPDALIRCGEHPRATFEVVSPSELKDWQGRDRKRRDVQSIASVSEIVEIYQRQLAVHVYRRGPDGAWIFSAEGGPDAVLDLFATGERMSIPLAEIYEFALPFDAPETGPDA